jgi:O-antigen ligase
VALIFWLPGPIDHFWDVPVSFFATADETRYLSLLDFIYLGALLFIPKSQKSGHRWIELSVGFLLSLLILYTLINVTWQVNRLEPARVPALLTGTVFLRLFLVYLVVMKFINTRSDYHRLYLGIIMGSLGLIVNSAYKFFTGETMSLRLVAGTFGNNVFGALLGIEIVLIYIYISNPIKKWMKHALIGLQLICLIFILLSGVRIALVIMAVGLLGASLLRQRNILKTLSRIFMIVIPIFIILFLFARFAVISGPLGTWRAILLTKVITGQATSEETREALSTLEPRFVFWKFAVQKLTDSPWFGIGPGQWNFERVYGDSKYLVTPNGLEDSVSDPHNGYIYIAVEYGWPVLVLYLWLIILCLIQGWETLRITRRMFSQFPWMKRIYSLTGGLMIAVLMIQIGEMTNSYILKPHTQLFIGLLLFGVLRSRSVLVSDLKAVKVNEESC